MFQCRPVSVFARSLSTAIVFTLTVGAATQLLAQAAAPAAPAPAAAPGQAPAPKKIPPPEDVTLATEDGLGLRATFFPSTEGKDAVPVILLHAWKGSRGDMLPLASYLQQLGHAVIAPDLRGHGESTRLKSPQTQKTRDISATSLKPMDYAAMLQYDMETVKAFIRERNNAGEMNLEKLCVVGVEMGALVAVNWAATDWAWPVLSTGKQGQDVKALVLIAPEWTMPGGFSLGKAMSSPAIQKELSLMLIAGSQNKSATTDATRINNLVERFHPEPAPEDRAEKKDLFFIKPDTSLSGAKMLGEPALNLNRTIGQFIEYRLVKKAFPWTERKG